MKGFSQKLHDLFKQTQESEAVTHKALLTPVLPPPDFPKPSHAKGYLHEANGLLP